MTHLLSAGTSPIWRKSNKYSQGQTKWFGLQFTINPEIRRDVMRKKLKRTNYIRDESENIFCAANVFYTNMQVNPPGIGRVKCREWISPWGLPDSYGAFNITSPLS